MGVELVFFYGPPYAGKTLFYLNHFHGTHQRVCPSAIFDSDPHITLRGIILQVVALLKKSQSVVLDDENEFRHTRASYINLIKAKVPDCRFVCIEFQVSQSDGRFQSNWAREWNIAQVFHDERKISKFNPLEKERKLHQWFEEEKIDPPCDTEGFEVSRVQTGLSCDCPYEFEVPALFMQIEVLSPKKLGDGTSNIENLTTIINTWTSVNTTGRVIFLGNIQHSCHQAGEATGIGDESSYDECCSCLGHAKEKLRQLALEIDTPLYFALADYSLLQYPFILPPQPGLLAWIQRLHTIDITHKSSLYVCMTEAHTKMAQCAGLKTLKTKKVMNNPKTVTSINCRTRQSAVPVCVSESTVSYYGHISLSSGVELESESSGCGIRPSPHIPLLDKARASCKQMEQPCIVTEFAMGRYHGVCFKNLEMLEKYQELYETTASPTDVVFCIPYKPDCIKPSLSLEPTDQQNIPSSSATLPKDEQADNSDISHNSSDLKGTKSDCKTVVSCQSGDENLQSSARHCVKLEREDIERLALSESRYKKGKEVQHLIKGLHVTPDKDNAEELLRISCTCKGSQGQDYDVFAVIGNQGIKQAKCSCLDSASKTGQCKHVVAMLLKYIDKDEPNNKRENRSHSISNPVSQPEKNEVKNSKSFKRKRKSSQRVAGWQDTVYVMSSRELLETANQILQEHNQSHKDRTDDEEETKVLSHETKTPRDILSTDSSRVLSMEKETAENANETSPSKQQDLFLEDKQVKKLDKSSPRGHFTENPNQMNKEGQSLYEETKRQRTSYGKSILDEII